MDGLQKFLVDNIKSVFAVFIFLIGFYMQHQSNIEAVTRLEVEQEKMNARIDAQYAKLDELKLDKSVYETQMQQIYGMSQDIREIRENLENMMQRQGGHYYK